MNRRAAANVVLFVAGGALLVWQVDAAGGLGKVRDGLGRIGAGFVVILLLQFVRFVLRSYAWLRLLNRPAPLASAVAATIAGDALGNVTVFSLAASEPAKAVYLGRHVDTTQAFAALTAENFFYTVSLALYALAGAVALLVVFDLPAEVRQAGIAALVLMAAVLVIAGWVAWQRPAALSAVMSHVPSTRLRAFVERVRDFETRTYGSTGHPRARLGAIASIDASFHVVSFLESWITVGLLTGASHPLEALILDSVNRVINVVFKFVPGRVGVDEFSAEAVSLAMGLPVGLGVTLGLVRKIRMLVYAAVGVGMWTMRDRRPHD